MLSYVVIVVVFYFFLFLMYIICHIHLVSTRKAAVNACFVFLHRQFFYLFVSLDGMNGEGDGAKDITIILVSQ